MEDRNGLEIDYRPLFQYEDISNSVNYTGFDIQASSKIARKYNILPYKLQNSNHKIKIQTVPDPEVTLQLLPHQ